MEDDGQHLVTASKRYSGELLWAGDDDGDSRLAMIVHALIDRGYELAFQATLEWHEAQRYSVDQSAVDSGGGWFVTSQFDVFELCAKTKMSFKSKVRLRVLRRYKTKIDIECQWQDPDGCYPFEGTLTLQKSVRRQAFESPKPRSR